MVKRSDIEEMVKEQLSKGMFLVDVHVSASNVIKVLIDSFDGITIDKCVDMSRFLEKNLDRETEDYELQVSSPGLSEPFRVLDQYLKNKGRQIEMMTVEGEKYSGLLKEVTSDRIVLETTTQKKVEGFKKKQRVIEEHQFNYGEIKSAKVIVTFK
ncbi:MAG: ribosome assembly cofactor RimP [Mariniphaga sp.]|nr:ribosome assembly cofactor RimP [Mariniphaga sp.]MDD4424338.1 ribosome assembly cofactor RimP [Mariniphaga sp.]